jgi:hypothetical protein
MTRPRQTRCAAGIAGIATLSTLALVSCLHSLPTNTSVRAKETAKRFIAALLTSDWEDAEQYVSDDEALRTTLRSLQRSLQGVNYHVDGNTVRQGDHFRFQLTGQRTEGNPPATITSKGYIDVWIADEGDALKVTDYFFKGGATDISSD